MHGLLPYLPIVSAITNLILVASVLWFYERITQAEKKRTEEHQAKVAQEAPLAMERKVSTGPSGHVFHGHPHSERAHKKTI